jgi:hypothetical protein
MERSREQEGSKSSNRVEPEKKTSHVVVQRLKEQLRDKTIEITALQKEVQALKNSEAEFENQEMATLRHECYMAAAVGTERAQQHSAECERLEARLKEKTRLLPFRDARHGATATCPQCAERGGEAVGNQPLLEHIAQIQKENWDLRHQLAQTHVKINEGHMGSKTPTDSKVTKKHSLVCGANSSSVRAARYAADHIQSLLKMRPSNLLEDGHDPQNLMLGNILVAVQTLSDCVGHKMFLELHDSVDRRWTCWVEVLERTWEEQHRFEMKHLSRLQHINSSGGGDEPSDTLVCPTLPDVKLAAAAACLQIARNPASLIAPRHKEANALVDHLRAQAASTTNSNSKSQVMQILWAKKKASGGTVYEFLLSIEGLQKKTAESGLQKKTKRVTKKNKKGYTDAAAASGHTWLLKCQMFLPINGWDSIRLLTADLVEGPTEVHAFLSLFFTTLDARGVEVGRIKTADTSADERVDFMRLQLEGSTRQFATLQGQLQSLETHFREFEVRSGREKGQLLDTIQSLEAKLAATGHR